MNEQKAKPAHPVNTELRFEVDNRVVAIVKQENWFIGATTGYPLMQHDKVVVEYFVYDNGTTAHTEGMVTKAICRDMQAAKILYSHYKNQLKQDSDGRGTEFTT